MDHVLQRVMAELLLPPFSPFLLLMLAWWIRPRFAKTSLVLGSFSVLLLFGASLSIIGTRSAGPFPPLPDAVKPPYPPAEAIVVLGGGRYLNAREYAGDTAGPSTLERVRYAAKIHRETGKPILVTGGKPGGIGQRSEAEIMRDILVDEFRLPVQWVEPEAQETKQNATYSAKLLNAAGIKRIYLVTHGAHMDRADAEFRAAGFDVVKMITGFIGPEPETVFSWVPSFHGLAVNRGFFYELLAKYKPF